MIFLTLAPLRSELLPEVLELDSQCFGGLWTMEGYQRELESPNSCLLALTCSTSAASGSSTSNASAIENTQKSERLLGLGCLWSILEEAHLTILAVHPSCQRQGFGQVLLHALLTTARQQGLERATLEVRVSNQSALSLYQKFGFREAGRRRRYYSDTGEDGLILWLSGLQQPEFGQQLLHWQQQIDALLSQTGWFMHRSLPIAANSSS